MELLLEFVNKGIIVMLTVTMPCICTAAAIGLVVGILQAVTQVQEQTIAAAPKVLGVFLVLLLGGVGFTRLITNVFLEGTELAFNVMPKQDNFVLDENYYHYTKPFSGEMSKLPLPVSDKVKKVSQSNSGVPYLTNTEKIKQYPSNRTDTPHASFVEEKAMRGN